MPPSSCLGADFSVAAVRLSRFEGESAGLLGALERFPDELFMCLCCAWKLPSVEEPELHGSAHARSNHLFIEREYRARALMRVY